MDLFKKHGYFSESDNEHSFMHKLTSAAKIAGIIGAAVVTQPYWSRLAGKIGTTTGEYLSENTKLTGSSVDAVVKDLFPEEAQAFYDFPTQLRRAIATSVNKETKINDFLTDVSSYVDKAKSSSSFDDVKGHLSHVLDAVGKVGSLEDTEFEKNIVSPEAMEHFTRAAHSRGIIFNDNFKRNQRQIFEDIVARTSGQKPTDERIAQFISNPSNRENILKAFQHLHEFHSRKTELSRNFINYGHLEELTFERLNDTHVSSAVEEYLDKVGMASPPNNKGTRVESLLERAKNSREKLFALHSADGSQGTYEESEKLAKLMAKTKTGLALTKEGKVISIAQMKHKRVDLVNKALTELQIPLVPYAFNVPLRTFRFLEPSKELIRNLGTVANEPELKRIGQLAHRIHPYSQALGLGDRLMIITPGQNPTLDFIDDMRFMSYKKRENPHTRRLSGIRGLDVENFLKNIKNFRGSEDIDSDFVKKLQSSQSHFLDIDYDPINRFTVKARSKIYSPLVNKLYGTGRDVNINHLHPTQLAKFIHENKDRISSEDLKLALNHIIGEAKNARIDISTTLKTLGKGIKDGSILLNKDIPHYGHLTKMLEVSDNPTELLNLMNSELDIGQGTLFDQISKLEKRATQSFYRAVTNVNNDRNSLLDVTVGEGGVLHKFKAKAVGKEGISQSYEKLQEGLLAETIQNIGVAQLDQLASRGGLTTENAAARNLIDIHQALKSGDLESIRNSPLMDSLSSLGFTNRDGSIRTAELDNLTSSMVKQAGSNESALHNGYNINKKALGQFASIATDKSKIFGAAENGVTKAKIIYDLKNNLDALEVFRNSSSTMVHRNAEMLLKLSEDHDIAGTLKERFILGRPFHLEENGLIPTNINNYYTLPGSETSLEDFLHSSTNEKINTISKEIKRGFGIPEYLSSIIHPNKAMGQMAMATQVLLQMPNEIGSKMGLGIPAQDRITTLRSGINFFGKRVLPLIVGFEAYKNLNSNMHSLGIGGLDDMAANVIANVNIGAARIKDTLGLTGLSQNLVNSLPGLDLYFHPRSEKEYDQYLYYGDEEVRQGRGWLIGSRNPLHGTSIKYMRPNFFRRWHSHWTEADNVDISNSKYSFLPNLLHPLAPLNLLLHPNWWVDKHLSDRPYKPGGNVTPQNNDPNKTFLTINSEGSYGALAMGTFGGGYPVSMTGGGTPMQLGPTYGRGSGGIGGTGGIGGIGNGHGGSWVAGGDQIRMGLHKAMPQDSIEGHGALDMASRWLQNARSQMGLYGAVMQRLPFYPDGINGAFSRQTPKAAIGFSRMAWSGEYGEILGPAGEFFRRFVHPDSEGFDAYNPLPNNMPSWLPAKFHEGDPYMRTPGIGELQLPGDAFERTHPWVEPLRVRGSNIGLSEEEIVSKWMNPLERITDEHSKDIVDFGCVDEETEILTKHGWKTYHTLNEEDIILTLNHTTGFTEWQPIQRINKYDVVNEPLILIENRFHNSLTTSNHRWPVIHEYQKHIYNGVEYHQRFEREWTTSDKLGPRLTSIILGAKNNSLPITKKYSDAFVELVAWFWTEGTINNKSSCHIYQSKINPEYTQSIRQALNNWLGPENLDMKTKHSTNGKLWRELRKDSELIADFSLNVQASKELLEVVPNKFVSCEFIKELTEDQLRIFIGISAKADGKCDNQLGQKKREAIDALELAAILLGKRINIRESFWTYRYKEERFVSEHIIGFHDEQLYRFNHYKGHKIVDYTGIVWCPSVQNETWCARRKGKVFYTGNSTVHKKLQRELNQNGMLVGAEVSIFDKEHNLSGTLDAVIRTDKGLEILDFKTQGGKKFEEGEVPERYKDQLTFYMHQTGIHQSQLVFVNRDDTSQRRFVDVDYDPSRWESILAKVSRARETMNQLVKKGSVSPFEAYDIVSRSEILAKVAPDSPEFRNTIQVAQDSGLGGFEKQRVEQAIATANKMREEYNLYPKRYGIETETQKLRVEGIGADGSIITELGTLSLAGVKLDPQAFDYEDPEDVLRKFGVKVGSKIPVTLIKGHFNPETMHDEVTPAIVGKVNKRILNSQYGNPDSDSRNPLSEEVLHGNHMTSKIWEMLVHTDSMLTNKFMRVRTGLEQFERGEVFGTDNAKWDDPINNFVKPTINALISKNPFESALKSATIARLFVDSKIVKNKVGMFAGLIGGGLSLTRSMYEHISGNTWTPKSYNHQSEFDEYWDMLEYIKFTAIEETAKTHALKEEHTDIDKLRNQGKRETVPLGPWAVIAIDAERKARRTLFGFDEMSGSLQDALSAIPNRHQQIAESIIETGSLKEKQRFYNLLPDTEKRVLGKFLNVDTEDLPDRPNLTGYFKHHFLPNQDWMGWDRQVDLDDLRTRGEGHEGTKIERPSRAKIEKARAFTQDISIPRMDSPTPGNIRRQIAHLLNGAGFEHTNVKFDLRPSDTSSVNVRMDLFEDQTKSMLDEMRKDSKR